MQAANRGENVTIFFINNAIYGMTGGQMAPTSLIGMQTATSPGGRRAENEGFPIKVCELLNTLDAPYYLERVALGNPKHNRKTRTAVRKAIQYQLDNKGFTLVEVLSPCPTGWKMTSVDAAKWTIDRLTQVFPLGVFRDGHELELGHPRIREDVPLEKFPELLETNLVRGDIALPDKNVAIETASYKFAGFGGQGVLLLGMLMANAGMLAGRQVSWIPSYGPEMRGGTANCGVTISDDEIGSPLIQNPSVLVAMNGPSLERFGGDVVSGGSVYYNSSMINEAPKRSDVTSIPVPANEIAERERGSAGRPAPGDQISTGASRLEPQGDRGRHGCRDRHLVAIRIRALTRTGPCGLADPPAPFDSAAPRGPAFVWNPTNGPGVAKPRAPAACDEPE
jgi:2-oxoisovalerate ferredoxin oxidoreductase beta subunit